MNNKKQKHKQLTIITIIFSIISLVFLSTIAYSAFSSTMNITGIAHARVEANVRITDFELESTTNAISSYEDFGKNHISTSIDFKENASATYKIEVTNYGTTDIGIYNITGLPTGVSYEFIDYNLKDKICDESNKCNSFIKKVFYIKFTGSNINTDLTINFEFRVIHNITYTGFSGTYPKSVYDQESLTVDLSHDSPSRVLVEASDDMIYNYKNNILTLNKVNSNVSIEAINELTNTYDYTGNYQTFTAPYDAVYKIELWGAQGGISSSGDDEGGMGGYVSGEISLKKNDNLYIYVGESPSSYFGGYNGGGTGKQYCSSASETCMYFGGGGGATDIRITSGEWNDFNSLKSRIMVAGAGSAAYNHSGNFLAAGQNAGGLIGEHLENVVNTCISYGGTQTTGGTCELSTNTNGGFGYGGNGVRTAATGGGSGYYGGAGRYDESSSSSTGGGGSSFISGHNGCDAITETSTETNIIHTGQSTHYSGYKFTNTKMIDGSGYNWTTTKGNEVIGMPTHDGTSTMTGNTGDGYAKITLAQVKNQYNITYTNIDGNYQKIIYKHDDLTVDFGSNAPSIIKVYEEGIEKSFTYQNGVITVKDITDNIEIRQIQTTYNFNYTGTSQTFTVPYTGLYKVELWGAGQSNGGYVSGKINLTAKDKLYVYVGQSAYWSLDNMYTVFNGGGDATEYNGHIGTSGAGATDIRLVSGAWDDFNSLKSRILVAAGGGSAGSAAGGLIGGSLGPDSWQYAYVGHGGTQTHGGEEPLVYNDALPNNQGSAGGFGYGGKGGASLTESGGSGGGGGYYGGSGASGCNGWWPGGGGSSFISGHNGCDAITESSIESNIIHTGQSIHYSGYQFRDTIMIDGAGYNWTTEKGTEVIGMPTHDGTGTMTGNNGNGYAKITLINTN